LTGKSRTKVLKKPNGFIFRVKLRKTKKIFVKFGVNIMPLVTIQTL